MTGVTHEINFYNIGAEFAAFGQLPLKFFIIILMP